MKACTRRDVFLQIESVDDYSPLAPLLCARRYGRDCMHNEGHELGRIPADEILQVRIDALVYREYLDADYMTPNPAPLVPSDITEPPWHRRVPGAVIWAKPGERLYIHVRNADRHECHSLHVHGLRYGIESDGAWPLGVATKDDRRSDEILPGERWTYVFDITEETIGAWPFHDHVRHVAANVNRGLFGAIIVRDPRAPCADHEVPLFVHAMAEVGGHCKFESATLATGQTFEFTFPDAGELCDYICRIHGASMAGRVHVVAGAPSAPVHVKIEDNKFTPADVTITAGTNVVWTNAGANQHIIFAGGGGKLMFCLNGRAFVGNTPIIVGDTGQTVRWYLFNLDVGGVWHNFHPHSARWQLPAPPGIAADVHSLSPVESFVIDTEVPPALRLPCELEALQQCPPADACQVMLRGDFLFHCHIEEHMMTGLAGLVRARQKSWITEKVLQQIQLALPLAGCLDACDSGCVPTDLKRCCLGHTREQPPAGGHTHGHAGSPTVAHAHAADMPRAVVATIPEHVIPMARHMPALEAPGHAHETVPLTIPALPPFNPLDAAKKGYWELLPCEAPVLAVHAALMHTGKVLFFAGSGNDELYTTGLRSAVYDYENGTFSMPDTPTDVFCAGQSFLADGRLLVAGGTERYDAPNASPPAPFVGLKTTLIFDPITEQWTFVHPMKWGRWYPTLVTLGDGHVLAASGIGNTENELYSNPTGWTVSGPSFGWPLYPHLHLLIDGRIFHSGMRLGGSGVQPGFLNPTSGAYAALPPAAIPASFNFGARDEGATVLLPPAQDQRIMVMGGGEPSINTVHIIKTDAPSPAWVQAPSMLRNRVHVNAVILPDRTVIATGGSARSENAATASLEAEIFDLAANTWLTGAAARVPRLYHSIALLMPDGRVLTAGGNPSRRNDELRLEVYHPPYLFRGPRPCIERALAEVRLGDAFEIHTPNAVDIKWISLVRPMATTHSYDSEQRLVDIPFRRRGPCKLAARMPDSPNLVPPGYYMLFIVNRRGVPSVAKWVRVNPATARGGGLQRGDIIVGTSDKLVRVDAQSFAMSVITQGGALGNADGVAFDAHGHIVVATDGGEVIHVDPTSGAQNVVHSSDRLYQDVAVKPDGDYLVVNLPSATPSGLFAINHTSGAATRFNTGQNFGDGPTGVVIGKDGHYYVAGPGVRAVIRVDQTTGVETVVSQGGHFVSPSGIAVAPDGHLFVVDHGADKVIHVDPATGTQNVVSAGGHLQAPVDIAVDGNGKILVVDLVDDKLIRIEPTTGAQTVIAQGGLLAPVRSIEVLGT